MKRQVTIIRTKIWRGLFCLLLLLGFLLATPLFSPAISGRSVALAKASSIPAGYVVPAEITADQARQFAATSSFGTVASTNDIDYSTLKDTLIVRFLNVGQGDAALISCGGHHVLIDGGPAAASSLLYSVIKNTLGITKLDCVIATHPDADHIGGISGALNALPTGGCKTAYCSKLSSDTKTFESMVKYLQSIDCALSVPKAGTKISIGQATLTILYVGSTLETDNNSSIICRIDYGATSFLFAADAESEEEDAILRLGLDLDADVLKVAHHGSRYSSTAAFLREVSPTYAVISVGENEWGHPTQDTLNRLTATGATILRTDELGHITFKSDGQTITVSNGKRVTE